MATLVYIHGESYEWNSGNLYDGTVLAAHSNIIVVTINFRLGVLGELSVVIFHIISSIVFCLDAGLWKLQLRLASDRNIPLQKNRQRAFPALVFLADRKIFYKAQFIAHK